MPKEAHRHTHRNLAPIKRETQSDNRWASDNGKDLIAGRCCTSQAWHCMEKNDARPTSKSRCRFS